MSYDYIYAIFIFLHYIYCLYYIYYIYIYILRSGVKGTIVHVADKVLLGNRHSNRDPDPYRLNSIQIKHNFNNNKYNLNNNAHDPTDFDDGFFCHIFQCRSKRCHF